MHLHNSLLFKVYNQDIIVAAEFLVQLKVLILHTEKMEEIIKKTLVPILTCKRIIWSKLGETFQIFGNDNFMLSGTVTNKK